MATDRSKNRKLLVSVFNAQEAREAILGGARIVDSEDPRSALGNIKPRHIMAISDAVLNCKRDLDVQLSTNIGEDQLLFDRSPTGEAIEKSPYEIAGKAAQAAIGVAVAMGSRVHDCNLIKVGLDGMSVPMLAEVLEEVVETVRQTEQFSHSQVMSVLFAQDLDLWEARRSDNSVRADLVAIREFHPSGPDVPAAFDLCAHAVGTLKDRDNRPLFTNDAQVNLNSLIAKKVLPEGARHSFVALNELYSHGAVGMSPDPAQRRTSQEVIKRMVDATAEAGADAIMLDTSILMKACRVSLLKTSSDSELVDVNALDDGGGRKLSRDGILTLAEIRFFVDYCHYKGLEANLAGSLYSCHAQQLWRLVPTVDQQSTRGGSTAIAVDPSSTSAGSDTRHDRVTHRNLVRGLAPPEHGGVLNLPKIFNERPGGPIAISDLLKRSAPLDAYWVDELGRAEKIQQ